MEGVSRFKFPRKSSYDRFMEEEGLPVVEGWSIYDVRNIERRPWKRLGGSGAFIQLYGQEDFTGLYVVEIPGRQAVNIERHMYEELYYIIEGKGATEVKTLDGRWQSFEWKEGALFAIPLNAEHRLINTGSGPCLALAETNAPLMIDHFRNRKFIFECDFEFTDRYDGSLDYFVMRQKFVPAPPDRRFGYIDTNFIEDVRNAPFMEGQGKWKGKGFDITGHEMAGNVVVGHYAEFLGGTYSKSHAHVGGAVLLILKGEGYALMWPPEAGVRPYEAGNADKVIRADFKPDSIYSPGSGWYHSHLNTSNENVRELALRYGSAKWSVGFHRVVSNVGGPHVSIREGGTVIDFDLEDPQIRKDFKAELSAKGVPYRMDPKEAS